MTETWRDIAGFEGRYQVSDAGRVKSLPFKQRYVLRNGKEAYRRTQEKHLATQKINSGYLIVHLHLDNVRLARTVHSLVAKAFLFGAGETVNHKDGNKLNNLAGNLEYCTHAENHNHAVDLGLNRQAIAVRSPATGRVYFSMTRAAKAEKVSPRTVRATFLRVTA
jgi:hypothetical protein